MNYLHSLEGGPKVQDILKRIAFRDWNRRIDSRGYTESLGSYCFFAPPLLPVRVVFQDLGIVILLGFPVVEGMKIVTWGQFATALILDKK